MQIDLVPELPPSAGYENIVTAMDVFSRYLFAYPTSNQDAKTTAKVIINIMTKHAYLRTTIVSDKGTAFVSHVVEEVAACVLGITLKYATTKHAQAIGLFERSHASIKQTLKIKTGGRISLWHKNVNIAVLKYKTSYHTSIGCEPSRDFLGRTHYNILDLKLRTRPQQQPIPTSQTAQDVIDQTEMMFAKIPCKLTSNTKPITTKRPTLQNSKKRIMYTFYRRKDHQWSKIAFTEFRWVGPYIIEKVLPNKNYLVRKTGRNKTRVLHRMRMRQFTPCQPPADIRITPQEHKPDPDVSLKHDDLYARALEYDYEQPFFDAKNNKTTPPNSHENPVQSVFSTEEIRNTPGTKHECSPQIFLQTNEFSDVTDTYPHMERDVEARSEQPETSPTNPRSFKYNLHHIPKPNCNDDYRY